MLYCIYCVSNIFLCIYCVFVYLLYGVSLCVFGALYVSACVCTVCVCVCSEQPPQHHSLSAPGFSSEDLQEAQFCQELQSLTVCWLYLAEHTLRTYTHMKMLSEDCALQLQHKVK